MGNAGAGQNCGTAVVADMSPCTVPALCSLLLLLAAHANTSDLTGPRPCELPGAGKAGIFHQTPELSSAPQQPWLSALTASTPAAGD